MIRARAQSGGGVWCKAGNAPGWGKSGGSYFVWHTTHFRGHRFGFAHVSSSLSGARIIYLVIQSWRTDHFGTLAQSHARGPCPRRHRAPREPARASGHHGRSLPARGHLSLSRRHPRASPVASTDTTNNVAGRDHPRGSQNSKPLVWWCWCCCCWCWLLGWGSKVDRMGSSSRSPPPYGSVTPCASR